MPNYMLHDINYLAEEAARWVKETFGHAVYRSPKERALRLLEEAVELAQSSGVYRDQAVKVLEHVYAKPKGNPRDELVDVFFCTLVYANLAEVKLGEEVIEEQRLIWSNEMMTRIQNKYEDKIKKGLTAFDVTIENKDGFSENQ